MHPDVAHQALRPNRRRSWLVDLAGVVAIAVVTALVALFGAGMATVPGRADARAGAVGDASPVELVRRHHADLAAGHYQSAWQQLSPSAQGLVEFDEWARSSVGTVFEPSGLEVAAQSPTSATVVGDVTITFSGVAPTAGRGQWTLALVDGAWRLDTVLFTSATSSDEPSEASR